LAYLERNHRGIASHLLMLAIPACPELPDPESNPLVPRSKARHSQRTDGNIRLSEAQESNLLLAQLWQAGSDS